MYPAVEIKKKEIFLKNNILKQQTENPKIKQKQQNNINNNMLQNQNESKTRNYKKK